MPIFTDRPPEHDAPHAFRIIRTPATATVTAVVTSTDIVCSPTHFAKNRTVPCEGPDKCPWCAEGHSHRWHAYLGCVITQTYEHAIFECTKTAAETFANYYKVNATLRACKFTARRPSGKHNGRIVIACTRLDEQRVRLPEPPDVVAILCHIWNVKRPTANTDGLLNPRILGLTVENADDDGRYRPGKIKNP